MLDVVIKGGTIVDGTGGPSQQADLGIRDGRIVAVGAIGIKGLAVRIGLV